MPTNAFTCLTHKELTIVSPTVETPSSALSSETVVTTVTVIAKMFMALKMENSTYKVLKPIVTTRLKCLRPKLASASSPNDTLAHHCNCAHWTANPSL